MLEFHECSPEEFDQFAPPMPESAGMMKMYRESDTRPLHCIDMEKYGDDLAVWGNEADESLYQRFEFILTPCNYIHTEMGDVGDFVSDECIPD